MTFDEILGPRRLIAILRGLDLDRCLEIAEAVWAADAGVIEVPVQDAEALRTLRVLAAEAERRGQRVGAGTVVSTELVRRAADHGAAFTIAPGFDPDVAAASLAAGLPHLPGVATAGEIQAATRAGFGWLKVFPAGSLGASWLREMRGPFPDRAFVATGGVAVDNAEALLAAGARALGVGSAIASPAGLRAMLDLVAVAGRAE